MMVVGNLVQFIGDARFYKGRIGIVTQAFEGAVLVHFAGATGQGRDLACAGQVCATRRADEGKNTHCHLIYWNVLSPTGPCTEWIMERGLEVISESR